MASGSEARNRRLAALATIGACVLAAVHAWTWRACGPLDDDAILYRYGANLAHGLGLAFNAGERVEGFTAPPLVLFHALVELAGLDHVGASRLLGIAAFVATVWILAVAWRTLLPKSIVPWPAALVAAAPAFAFHANAGLGTTLGAACVAAWMLGEVRRACAERAPSVRRACAERAPSVRRACAERAPSVRRDCSDLTLGFACLLRPELHLLAIAASARLAGQRAWKRAAVTLALPLAWLLFRLAYFGAWLPNTYHAKKLPLLEDLARGWSYLRDLDGGSLFFPFALVLLAAAWIRRPPPPLARELATAAAIVMAGAVFVGGDHMPFARLLVPGMPIVALALMLQVARGWGSLVAVTNVTGVAMVALLQSGQRLRAEREASFDQLERRWRAIGVALRERAEPSTLVATEAIGFVGYESRLPLVDMLGLVDPVIAREAPHVEAGMKGHTKYDAGYVLSRRPDLILLGDGLLDGSGKVPVFVSQRDLAAHPRFAADYTQASVEIPGSYPLVYWKRRDGRGLR